MTLNLHHRFATSRWRLAHPAALAAVGLPAAALASGVLAPNASADEMDNPLADLAGVVDNLPTTPLTAPGLPIPLPVLPDGAVLPVNMLRRDTPGAESITKDLPVEVPTSAPPVPEPAPLDAGQIAAAHIASDPSVLGQWIGVGKAPTPDQLTTASAAVTSLIDRGIGGAIADIQHAVDTTWASPEYQAWASNTANPFHAREGQGIERAAEGISALIDSFTARPEQTLAQILTEAGGPARILTDPVGALNDVAGKIAGPEFVADLHEFVTVQLGPSLAQALRDAAPAALIPLATAALGALAGIPAGAVPAALLGGLIGALNPLAPLVGLLTAIPGALLGGAATGLLGLIGSTLATLPLVLGLPLLAGAGASALALAAAATVIFGTWLATVAIAAVISGVVGAVLGVIVAGGLMALAGLNPIMIPAAIIAGILVFGFITVMGTGAYTLFTALIPIIIFGVVAPLLTIGAGLLGALAGLAAGLAIAAIAIPLITALSALPGAIAGGLLGFLAGDLITTIISTLLGVGIGALLGALLGGLLGALIGGLAGIIPALIVAAVIAVTRFNDLASSFGDGAFGRLAEAVQKAWDRSALKNLVDRFAREFADTDTSRALASLGALLQATLASTAFLDGRRLREMILAAALRGAIPGAIAGAIPGGLLGALVGLLNPLNLLSGIPGGIIGALLGIPAGAVAGAGLSTLLGALTTLVVTPLSFLPILAGLTALWAIPAALSSLVALASALLPPLAIATGATIIGSLLVSAPLWIPITIAASIATIIAFALSNPVILAAATVAIPGIGGFLSMGGAFLIGAVGAVLAGLDVLVIGGALALGALVIGVPVFLLTLPLFIFPALAIPLLNLLALPLTIPVAAGLSLLTGLAAGSAVGVGSALLTVPLGALLGGLAGAGIGATTAVIARALARALTDGIVGATLGGLAGAGVGAVISVIVELLSHTQILPITESGGFGVDARLVNHNLPGTTPGGPKTASLAVPTAAAADYGFASGGPGHRRAVDVTDLIDA